LRKDEISTLLRHSKEGVLYGITYVDFKTKCVFNGSDLGKEYSAKRIQERCSQEKESSDLLRLRPEPRLERTFANSIDRTQEIQLGKEGDRKQQFPTILDEFMRSHKGESYLPHELVRKKKENKKKKRLHL
jgi:hypothetical protein